MEGAAEGEHNGKKREVSGVARGSRVLRRGRGLHEVGGCEVGGADRVRCPHLPEA